MTTVLSPEQDAGVEYSCQSSMDEANLTLVQKLKRYIKPLPAIKAHLSIEWQLLKREWPWIVYGALWNYFHAIFTATAYYVQGKLSVEQRFPLRDLLYEILGSLNPNVRWISDFFVFVGVFVPFFTLMLSILVIRLPDLYKFPNAQCRFVVLAAKRILMLLGVCIPLRCISFLGTTLPSPAEQCTVVIDQACAATTDVLANCVDPNPRFDPPLNVHDIFTAINPLDGCGDLMFSGHTIYTCSMILTMIFYWRNKFFALFLILLQLTIAILIIAARKHYTLDVFTALYVVPAMFFLLYAYYPDINNKERGPTRENILAEYGIDIMKEVDIYYQADGKSLQQSDVDQCTVTSD